MWSCSRSATNSWRWRSADVTDAERWRVFSIKSSCMSPPLGEKSMGCIRESKRFEGRSFHLRNKVQPMAAAPTTEATTMIAIRAFLAIPVDDDELSAAADVAEADVLVEVTVVALMLDVCDTDDVSADAVAVVPTSVVTAAAVVDATTEEVVATTASRVRGDVRVEQQLTT